MSEVFGSILAYIFLSKYMNENMLSGLYAIIAGIMLHISIYELIPTAYNKSTFKPVLRYILVGFIIMIASHMLIS